MLMNRGVLGTWDHPALRPLDYLPHFIRLTDWLPYGSGGFLLFQDSVERDGFEPPTPWASIKCSTNWATVPSMIMMEYPSRSNLNCFLSFNEASAKGDEFRFHSEESTFVEWGKPLSVLLSWWVVDMDSRFTISYQQVNALYEFTVSYHPPTFYSKNSFVRGVGYQPTNYLPPLLLYYKCTANYLILQTFFVVPVGFEPTTSCM